MNATPAHSKLDALLLRNAPLIDLRAPREFALGSLPGAVNLPILTDSERHQVGKCYRDHGQATAVKLGQRLVSGALKQARIDGWQRLLQEQCATLFCWRGGMRTEFACNWLQQRGLTPVSIDGGFKAARRRCLEILDQDSQRPQWLVLGGRTGVGKTLVINDLDNSIDLEGLARHRGSAFGAREAPQPTPINFENQLAVQSLRLSQTHRFVVLEDESRTIGRLALPLSWHARMQQAPLVLLEADIATRAAHIVAEYVTEPLAAGVPAATLTARYLSALQRIRKRLGGARAMTVTKAVTAAFAGTDLNAHLTWIRSLLEWYYDPMYDFQLANKEHRVVFRGDAQQVRQWLQVYSPRQDARG